MKKNDEKGIISLFVLFAMMFLLVFAFTIYFVISNRLKEQELENLEIKNLYLENIDLISANEKAISDEVIPIYNIDELNIIGTGSYIRIKDRIYQAGIGMSYILKDNIIVNVEEDIISGRIKFNDYKLYSSNFYIDKYLYDIYYYAKGTYWKNLYYKKYGVEKKESTTYYSENDFSIINNYNYSNSENYNFLLIWSDGKGKERHYEILSQNNKPVGLEQIEVYMENYDKIDKEEGEIYILLDIGNKI